MAANGRNEPMGKTTLERTSDTELVITRVFRAPPRIVFDAWNRADFVKRWWAPKSRGVTVVECSADVRAGGAYRYVLGREAERMAFFGTYREVVRPSTLVYTQGFEPVLGHPMPGEAVIRIDFQDKGESTLLVSREAYPSKDVLDGVIASGMESGMRETMDQLDELVAAEH